jgi:hypothetical protein
VKKSEKISENMRRQEECAREKLKESEGMRNEQYQKENHSKKAPTESLEKSRDTEN